MVKSMRFLFAAMLCWAITSVVLADRPDFLQSQTSKLDSLNVAPTAWVLDQPLAAQHMLLLAAKQSDKGSTTRSDRSAGENSSQRPKKRSSAVSPPDTALGRYASFFSSIGLPPQLVWEVMQQSNFMLEAIARSNVLYTGQKKTLVYNLLKVKDGKAKKSLRKQVEKVLGELTPTEQIEALLVMLNEPYLKSHFLQLPVDQIIQGNAPLNPNTLAVFGMERPKGKDYLAAVDSKTGLPRSASDQRDGKSGSGRDGRQGKKGDQRSGSSIKGMIDCLDILHPQGDKTAGGGSTGPDPTPTAIGTTPTGGWSSGNQGQPQKTPPSKGIGFGEAPWCYGLDISKLGRWASDPSISGNTPSPSGPSPIPYPNMGSPSQGSDTSGKVKNEGKNPAKRSSSGTTPKSTSGDQSGVSPGGVKSSNRQGKTQTNPSSSGKVKNEAKNPAKRSSSGTENPKEPRKPTTPSQTKGRDPDATNEDPCDKTDYEGFAACIGGSGAEPEDCPSKPKYASGIATPSGQWLGCPPNKAMALGLLPIFKLWDPVPLKTAVGLRLEMLSQPEAMMSIQGQNLINKSKVEKGLGGSQKLGDPAKSGANLPGQN